MKNYAIFILLFAIITMAFAQHTPNGLPVKQRFVATDTLPAMCRILPPEDIRVLHPFTTILTNIFPDDGNVENYNGCHYQFYTPDEKPQLAIRLIKWSSKKEAADDYIMQVRRHFESWGISPERLYGIADSAFFDLNPEDTSKCDECALVVMQGVYGIYISFKGQYEKVLRARKRESALKILQTIYDRIPGLAPSRIRNRQ